MSHQVLVSLFQRHTPCPRYHLLLLALRLSRGQLPDEDLDHPIGHVVDAILKPRAHAHSGQLTPTARCCQPDRLH
jgi:hypothetical protein